MTDSWCCSCFCELPLDAWPAHSPECLGGAFSQIHIQHSLGRTGQQVRVLRSRFANQVAGGVSIQFIGACVPKEMGRYATLVVIATSSRNGGVCPAGTRLKSQGTRRCPDTHQYPVATLLMEVKFRVPTTTGTVTLSSGAASTMHADFFNAWDQDELTALVDSCINAYPFSPENPKPAKCEQRE
jgi:hypothetical protein